VSLYDTKAGDSVVTETRFNEFGAITQISNSSDFLTQYLSGESSPLRNVTFSGAVTL
jgi:hypothetical protein